MTTSREGMSRRRFLASAGAGLAAGMAGEGWRRKKENEHSPYINEHALRELNQSQKEKIDFHTTEKKILPPELKAALKQFLQLQAERLANYGSSFQDATTASVEKFEHEGIDKDKEAVLKQKVWEELKRIVPNLGEYSEQNYVRTLAYDLPRALVEYGIFAKPLLYAHGNQDTDQLALMDVVYRFYTVDEVISSEIERWGKQIHRDTVYISGIVPGLDQERFDSLFASAEAQTMFQNVIIFSQVYREAGRSVREQLENGSLDIYRGLTPELLMRTIGQEGDTQELRAQGIQVLVYKQLADNPRKFREFSERILEHETGHLVQQADPEFADYFEPSATDQMSQLQTEKFEKSAKDEIAAVINELRYGNHKLASLFYAAQWYENTLERDYPHAKSAHWVIDQITQTILQAPDKFGLKVGGAQVSAETQILLQLPQFVDDPKFNDVMDLVKETFEATYQTESFKPEIEQTFGLRPATGIKEFVCTTAVVSGIALAVMTALDNKKPKA